MAKKANPQPAAETLRHGEPKGGDASPKRPADGSASRRYHKPSPLLDTRVIYCGDCLDQLRKLPDACIELIYIDPPFNSNRNYDVFWSETKEKRACDLYERQSLPKNFLPSLQRTH